MVEEFRDLPARFGPPLSSDGVKYVAVGASPPDGCSPMLPPDPKYNTTYKWVVLIRRYVLFLISKMNDDTPLTSRYNCSFAEKVKLAEMALFDAAIVYNVGSNELGQIALS